MTLGSADNSWEFHSKLSSIERTASPAIEEVGKNLANIDTSLDKKTPPPLTIKDEFNSKGIPKIETAFNGPAAKFTGGTEQTESTSIDPFQKTNKNYATLSPEEMSKRADVLKSLGIMDEERDGKDLFSVASSPVYGRGEHNYAEAYASNDVNSANEIYDRNVLDRTIGDDIANA